MVTRRQHQSDPHSIRATASVAVLLSALLAVPAFAQQTPPTPTSTPPPDPHAATVETLTVTAHAAASRSTIDARSYSLGTDLKSGAGTLADVLRDVPSVSVDIEGAVSLRGDSDVTILVDGKPSALFSGPGRAQAIQGMSADQFERVEVMTNPSAGQTAEGSGGIINLISKHPPKGGAAPSVSGTLKAEVGSGGRFDAGANGAYASGGLTLNGGADFRRAGFSRSIGTRYGIPDPVTGALDPANQVQDQRQRDDDLTVNAALGYDIDPRDHLDASVTSETYREVQTQTAAYRTAATSGPLSLDYLAPGFSHDTYASTSEALGLTRTLPGADQSLSAKLYAEPGPRHGPRPWPTTATRSRCNPDCISRSSTPRVVPAARPEDRLQDHSSAQGQADARLRGQLCPGRARRTTGVQGVSWALAIADSTLCRALYLRSAGPRRLRHLRTGRSES